MALATGRAPVARLVAVFGLVALGSLALLTYFTLTLSSRAVRQQAEERVTSTAQVSGRLVAQRVTGVGDVVESYAGRLRVMQAINGNERPEMRRQLDSLIGATPGLRAAWLVAPDGTLLDIVPDTPAVVGQRFDQRDWYRGVVASNKTYVSEGFQGAAAGNPLVVGIATPVRDDGGKVIAYMGAGYGLADIQQFVDGFGTSQGFELVVTDAKGAVLASPRGLHDPLSDVTDDPGVRSALRGFASVRAQDDVVAANAPIEGIGWTVTARAPTADVFAQLAPLRRGVLTSAGVLALASIGALFLLTALLRRQRAADERAREADERQRLLLDSTGDGIVGSDRNGVCTFANPAAARLFGYEPDELVGQELHSLLHHSHADGTPFPPEECPLLASLHSGTPVHVDNEAWWHRDGSPVPVEYGSYPVRRDGVVTGIVVTIRDVSERLAVERQLAAARDAALEANRLKSSFLANMSHEIRTPMNGVIGMTSLLLDTDLDKTQLEYVETIRSSSDALLTVINDILDFSKIEAGKLDIEDVDYDVRTVVEQVAELLAEAAFGKGLELLLDIDASVPEFVRGDPSRVRQVVTNLLSNAIKFTEDGQVVVRIKVDRTVAPRLVFEVEDTGIGIPPAALSRLFAPFTQADVSTTRRFGGTGLGLTISRQLVDLMGGEIGVESEIDRGSRFWFHVPLREALAPPPPFKPKADLAGVEALVVDDNEVNRRVLCDMLHRWGIDAVAVAGPGEGIELARARARASRPFDIALLDFHMPGMDGIELARALSTDPETSSVRLVMLTSAASRTEAMHARQAGILGYITKPIRRGALYTLLTTAMGGPEAVADTKPLAETGRSARLLVVEDNPVNQRITAYLLEKSGHRVDVAGNGIEALELLATAPYDAVLMDVQMPEMDGWAATEELRRREAGGARVPVIGLTAAATAEDVERCHAAGMDAVVTKPVREDELLATVHEWTARAGDAQPPASAATAPSGLAAAGSDDRPDLDDDALLALVELDPDGSRGVIDRLALSFVSEAKERVVELREAIANDDADTVRQAAHRLKGSSLYFGARLVNAHCRDLEVMGRDGDIAGAPPLVDDLAHEIDLLEPAIPAALARLRQMTAESA